jgi:large repetitive protein
LTARPRGHLFLLAMSENHDGELAAPDLPVPPIEASADGGEAAPSIDPAPDPHAAAPAEASDEAGAEPVVVEAPPAPPEIHAFDPPRGPAQGGTRVAVTGSRFLQGCVVKLGGVAHEAAWEDAGHLSFQTLASSHTGKCALSIENPDGTRAELDDAFSFDPAPIIVSVQPSWAPAEGGGVITLHGAHFSEGCLVAIDSHALITRWIDGTRVEADTRARGAGAADVVLRNADGQQATLPGALGFFEAPAITSIEPDEGSVAGGTEVTVRGRNLVKGSRVRIGAVWIDEPTHVSDAELKVITPQHATAEAVDVCVTDPRRRSHTLPGVLRYTPRPAPVIEAVALSGSDGRPAIVPNAGGARLVVRGRDFQQGCAVFLLQTEIVPTFVDATTLEIVAPAVPGDGAVDLRVLNPDGQSHTLERAFAYRAPLPPPVLSAVSPGRGSQVGGAKVAVLGADFADGVIVRFGDVAAQVKFLTHKELQAVTPPSPVAGQVAVEVVNPDGATARLDAGFDFEAVPPPIIKSVQPTSGPTTGGTKVTIEGENFTAEIGVFVDRERPQAIPSRQPNEIRIVMAPRKTPGMVDVEVSVPGVGKAIMKNAFRYEAVPAPVITSVSPNRVGAGGGAELTIAGKNFLPDSAVLVDGKPPKSIKFVDKQTLEVKLLPGVDGKLADVTVRNADGKEAVQKKAFQYDARYG